MFSFGSDRRKGGAPRKGRVCGRPAFGLAALLVLAPAAWGQSLNVDLDTPFSPPLGGGPPSDSFGGAANQSGRWSSVSVAGDADWLYDLAGNVRNIALRVDSPSGGISGGGFNNPANTGDFARLLNDASQVAGAWASWTFEGLTNGRYRVCVYAVKPSPTFTEAFISVNGSPEAVTAGIMPGNQFILGVTHTFQEADVLDGRLSIHVERNPNGAIANVNGFQITAI